MTAESKISTVHSHHLDKRADCRFIAIILPIDFAWSLTALSSASDQEGARGMVQLVREEMLPLWRKKEQIAEHHGLNIPPPVHLYLQGIPHKTRDTFVAGMKKGGHCP